MPPGAGTCTSSGVAVIAFVTALGGGTIRDLILGRFPTGWTQHPEYVYLVISAGVLTTVVASFMHNLRRLFLVLDAMGLVAFSLIGCSVAMTMGYPTVVVIMSGMITGICGGILRDVLCNKVPVVFQRELYASVSLAVCALFLGLNALGVHIDLNTAISFTSGLTLRLLAIWGGWRLPTFVSGPLTVSGEYATGLWHAGRRPDSLNLQRCASHRVNVRPIVWIHSNLAAKAGASTIIDERERVGPADRRRAMGERQEARGWAVSEA